MKKDAAKRYLATFFFSLDMLFLLENKIMAHLKQTRIPKDTQKLHLKALKTQEFPKERGDMEIS